METKKCISCGKSKSLDLFSRHPHTIDGRGSSCKTCDSLRKRNSHRTKDGLIRCIYGHQKSASKKRSHPPPTYSLSQLNHWIKSHELFDDLFNDWVNSDYNMLLTPSVDRLDDYVGYMFGNIRLTTWGENRKKLHSDRKNGINNKISKSVVMLDIDGCFIDEFNSTREASRITGISQGGISSVCIGRRSYNTAGGYKWKFKN